MFILWICCCGKSRLACSCVKKNPRRVSQVTKAINVSSD